MKASTVNGEIHGEFPTIATGRISRRRSIGGGGRMLSLESVNGSIALKRE